MSLSTKVLIGLVAGVVVGLFFGEYIAFLEIGGRAFVLFLQMTVLPYVACSLIAGIGNLEAADAVSLAKRAGSFLAIFWGLALGVVVLAPVAFPDWPSASFFSSNLVEQSEGMDFLRLFIPSNPFGSLANAVVPSVVAFSIFLGVALIPVDREKKRTLLEILSTLNEALSRITLFIVEAAPYGVFCIVAHAAGTMDPADFEGLQVYVIVSIAASLLVCLWILPGLVAALTPFRYREVVWGSRGALITALATGSLFVVLAVLAAQAREMLHRREEDTGDSEKLVDVVVPTSFTFPSAGKLLGLIFVLFAGWLSGFGISVVQLPGYLAAGTASFFGSTMVAIPFLLDLFQVPSDTFNLFVIADSIIGMRFAAMVAAMHTLALALLAACAMAGLIRVRFKRVVRYAVVTVILSVAVFGGLRIAFESAGSDYLGYEKLIEMPPRFEPVSTRVLDAPPETVPAVDRSVSALNRIRHRGFLRVGYTSEGLPFAFRNAEGAVVGFDIDMMNLLARELGVTLELVHIGGDPGLPLLASGYLDTVAGGVALTTTKLKDLDFATPHLDETLCFIVRDHERNVFGDADALRGLENPRIAVPDAPYYVEKLREYLPYAEITVLDSIRTFFRDEEDRFDALAYGAQSGSAWCLVYPQFSVAVPKPDVIAVPLAYPVSRGDPEMLEFLSSWVLLKQKDGTVNTLYRHWILGEATRRDEPRWSVIRNVLGWLD